MTEQHTPAPQAERYTISIRFDTAEQHFEALVAELPDVAIYESSPQAAYTTAIEVIMSLQEQARGQGRVFPQPGAKLSAQPQQEGKPLLTNDEIDAVCRPGRIQRWHGDGRQYDRDTARLIESALLAKLSQTQPLTDERITEILLAHGFKLKPQPDGSLALNPYVIPAVRACIVEAVRIPGLPVPMPEAQARPAPAAPAQPFGGIINDECIDAAEKHAANYNDDTREFIKTDVLNAFYRGSAWMALRFRADLAAVPAQQPAEPPRVPNGWQPIETAPKNRKVLVAYRNSLGNWRRVIACYYPAETLDSEHTESGWADEGWYEVCEAQEELAPAEADPLVWVELPAAPQLPQDQDTQEPQAMSEQDALPVECFRRWHWYDDAYGYWESSNEGQLQRPPFGGMTEGQEQTLANHAAAIAKIRELEQESDECDALRARLSDLLTRTAAALKGEPPPLTLHSWHDLPELADKATDALRTAHFGMVMATQRAEAAEARVAELQQQLSALRAMDRANADAHSRALQELQAAQELLFGGIYHALQSYSYGNSATALADEMLQAIDAMKEQGT